MAIRSFAGKREPSGISTDTAPQSGASRWRWLREWEFWLALALGAFLRLWHLGQTQFLDDQSMLITLARESILRHALPVTSNLSSIGTYHSAFSIYLLMPFVLTTSNPFPAIISIALWNVAAVALCYVFARRYFGRAVAAVATLTFATCGPAVNFSRFIWQPNYLPAFLVLWLFTLYAGALRGSRGWLAPNLALLAILIFLHPTCVFLAPVTVVAFLMAPRKPAAWEYAASAVLLALVFVPDALWQLVTHFADVHLLLHSQRAHAVVNLDVIQAFKQVLGAPTFNDTLPDVPWSAVTPESAYSALGTFFHIVWILARVIYVASYLILSGLVVYPIIARWRASRGDTGVSTRLVARLLATWRGLCEGATWRCHVLLWLCVTLPPLSMVRHSSPVYGHYLHVLYPTIFLVAGVGVRYATRWSVALAGWCGRRFDARVTAPLPFATRAVVIAVVGLFVAGQAIQMGMYLAAQAAGQVNNSGYGYPLSEVQGADTALATLQRQQGATATFVSDPVWFYHQAMDYSLVREHPDRAAFHGGCLVLPAPDAGATLVVSTHAVDPGATLLPTLPNARFVQSIIMPGGEPVHVYRVQGATPALSDETPLPGIVFASSSGFQLRLDAVAAQGPGAFRLRWTILGAPPTSAGTPAIAVTARASSSGGAAEPALARGECDPTSLTAGETMFTWVAAPLVPASGPARSALPRSLILDVQGQTASLWTPSFGPLALVSARPAGLPWTRLAASAPLVAPSDRATYAIQSDGTLQLTLPPSA